jgi:hypothetical protein
MKGVRRFRSLFVIQLALIPVFAIVVAAQPPTRRSVDDTRRAIANDTFRELMKNEREAHGVPVKADKLREARIQQLRDDFKAIQDINNRMMSAAWASAEIDYNRTSAMLGEINEKAVRLKNNLALPQAEKTNRAKSTVSGQKDFKSALLVMDRSLMSFVTNPIFRQNLMDLNLAGRAVKDLEDVISYSSSLKKIASNLKNAAPNR